MVAGADDRAFRSALFVVRPFGRCIHTFTVILNLQRPTCAVAVCPAIRRRTLAGERLLRMNIYIGNLASNISEDRLQSLFVEFGEIESVKVIKDRFSGTSKGYAFIEMPSNSEADKAIKALNGSRMDGNSITVRPADPGGKRKKKRGRRGRRF